MTRRPRVMLTLAGLAFLALEARHYARVPGVVARLASGQVAAAGGVASGPLFAPRLAAPAGRAGARGGGGGGGHGGGGGGSGGGGGGAGMRRGEGGGWLVGGGAAALAPGPLEADEKVNAAAERMRDAHLFHSAAVVSSRAAAAAAARAEAGRGGAPLVAPSVTGAGGTLARGSATAAAVPEGAPAGAVLAAAAAAVGAGDTPLPGPVAGQPGALGAGPAPMAALAVTAPPAMGAGAVAPPPPPSLVGAIVGALPPVSIVPDVVPLPLPAGTAGAAHITPSPQMVDARAAIEAMGGWVAPGAELVAPRAMLDAETAGGGDLMAANALPVGQAETDNRDLEADAEPVRDSAPPVAAKRGRGLDDGGGNADGSVIQLTTFSSDHGVTAATADAGDEDDAADARAVSPWSDHFRGVPLEAIDLASHGGFYETGTHNLTRVSHMLYRIIRHHNISSMLDVPCTAHVAWMPALLARLDYEIPAFRYQCMDSAPDVAAAARSLRGASESATIKGGVRYWEVPLPSVDLIFSWSGLEHLTLSRTFSFFYNVRASGSALALVGHHAGMENVVFRPSTGTKRTVMARPRPPGVNLREQPFAFDAAERVIGGFCLPPPPGGRGLEGRWLRAAQKQLLLYRVSKMRQSW